MANAENRPFTGTWTYNNKKIRRHVPDCIVTFNGETAMPSCTGCVGQIDLQDLITSVSVSNSTDTSPASVSLGMEIPTNRRSCFFRDNKFILHPGIEIHVYMRGYFSHTELGGDTDDPNYNLNKATMKPYYQVFNGVITEVTHGFSGGFYSMSLSATDFLHFWQYQSIATNPSYLGSKVEGNKTNINFTGHKYTRKNPFSVVHELYSSGHGDAGGHSWVLSDFQNIGIKSDLFQASFWEITGYYWQKRFQQPMGNLKMYGTDGRLFNSFEQFLLSSDLIGSKDAKKTSDKWSALEDPKTDQTSLGGINNYMDSLLTVLRHSNSKDGEVDKQKYAFPSSSLFYVDNTTWGVDTAKGQGKRGYNVAGVTAFALDISSLGQVNLFESQMQTKMDIASQVSTEIGYEFFIDFNGDYVFKPPFYNMDTSDSRVYVVKDIDLISFDSTEKEAECTVMKGTGGYFNNMASLFGKEFENRGMFVDWKGVAKYGWRESSFETTFLNDPKSIYYAAMNRLALANKDVQSGSCSIPLRPEMKLGFPVYIEPFDVYYYVTGISHTFGYGSDCTTSLTLTAKRAKFFPPMNKQSRFPTLQDIDFKNIYRPNHALFTRNGQGQPKYMGFPCVVLASDPNEINPLWFGLGEITNFLLNLPANTAGKSAGGNNYEGMITLVRALAERTKKLTYGLNPSGDITLHTVFVRDEQGQEIGVTFAQILEGAKILKARIEERIDDRTWTQFEKSDDKFADAEFLKSLETSKKTKKYSRGLQIFFTILDEVRSDAGAFIEAGTNMENYLASLKYMKSNFRPDDQQPGMYRYYSSAFPNDQGVSKTFQGMGDRQTVNVESLETGGLVAKTVTITHEVASPQPVVKVIDKGDGTFEIIDPNNPDNAQKVQEAGGTSAFLGKYGIPVRSFIYTDQSKGKTNNGKTYNVIPTEAIKAMCFAVQFLGYKKPLSLDILSSISFNGKTKNYSLLLPNYKKDPHPTGISVADVYDPFIENHLKGVRLITSDVISVLTSHNQKDRADSFQKFLDGLDAKYAKIQKKRYYRATYRKSRRGSFKTAFWALCNAMTADMKEVVKYLCISKTLTLAKEGKLSNFYNSQNNSIEASATIPTNGSYYSEGKTNIVDILSADSLAFRQMVEEIIFTVTMSRVGKAVDGTLEADHILSPQDSYERYLLDSWIGHPLYSSLVAKREEIIAETYLDNTHSYLRPSLDPKLQSGSYVARAARSEPFYSPVFPVSDEIGFEVFGQYAYGRGMTLKTLAEIIDTPPELWADLSPLELNRLYGAIGSRRYKKRRGGYGLTTKFKGKKQTDLLKKDRLESVYNTFDTNYRTTLNDSIANYITARGASEVISPDLIKAMENAGVDLTSTDEIKAHLKTWTTTGATSDVGNSGMIGQELAAKIFEQAFVQNIVTTNTQYGQKISASNVPIELARLDQFYSPTTCNGGAANALSTSDAFMVESDQYSFAYNSQTGDFNETAYQQMLAENKVMDWFTHQEALRGSIQEETITLDSLEEDFNAIGEALTTVAEDITQVPDVFGQMVMGASPERTQTSELPPPTINEEDE